MGMKDESLIPNPMSGRGAGGEGKNHHSLLAIRYSLAAPRAA
jgi:hypothetical protein